MTSTPIDNFKRALGAATKAIAGEPELEISFGGDVAGIVRDQVMLPSLPPKPKPRLIAKARGEADALALRLALHDKDIHSGNMPQSGPARQVFEAMEQARVEALGGRHLSGLGDNLMAALDARALKRGFDKPDIAKDDTSFAEAVGLFAREQLTGRKLPKSTNGIMGAWREEIMLKAAGRFDDLKTAVDDQDTFGKFVQDLIADFDMADERANSEEEDNQDDESQENEDDQQNDQSSEDDQEDQPGQTEVSDADAIEDENSEPQDMVDAENIDGEQDDSEQSPDANPQRPQPTNMPDPYTVYSTAHDEVIKAEDLCDTEELERLRGYLDGHMQGLSGAISRLANRLQRRLLAQQQRSWTFELEEGMLDTARLTRVITDPMSALTFKEEKETDFRDTVVTILIDNSGSMRGRPIMVAAVTADIMARTLERCGVKAEILGFTTRAWKGGKSFQDWMAAGKPPRPGRLNDLRHIVYKAADMPWRRAKRNLGLMMREGLLKENIDGEALDWAYRRLMARPEQRRILMVISDGAPVDDATQSQNKSGLLESHLRVMIDKIENRSEVELVAIGIGHDVTRWYKRAVTIMDVEQLGGVMTEKLAELFDDGGRR
ncbi:cobaltochelatase subunit CobT [Litorimonas cladophorae]|uniref:Cobaltochelatase subunit CobT n=1 Tax=Litorimonas cladophorae TaxID=1220491 RepID=A0A918KLP6_9PROT|nr:cobaltochelatase subunit CobT [Litorimonas cladophorae]GGX68104.1 cobaltochelatase subunit CobT [Litorimonas cladophorae]